MSVYITGIGVNSAIGNNVDETARNLIEGKTGIQAGPHQDRRGNVLPAGLVSLSNDELKNTLNLPAEKELSRATLLAFLAAKEALGSTKRTGNIREGLIASHSLNSLDLIVKLVLENDELDAERHGQILTQFPAGEIGRFIGKELEINDFVSTLSTACSSSANAIMLGARMIKHGKLDRALAGGVDAYNLYGVSGFKSLHIYDPEICRPFDQSRKGLNLGEGAGFLLLENESSLKDSGNTVLAHLDGWSNTNDAFHQTAAKEGGYAAVTAMREALVMAGKRADQVNYINAHGTATQNNDLVESQAMKSVFGNNIPPFSSTKSATGHTLGAAGGIEAVFSILALTHQKVWKNYGWKTPIEDTQLIPVKEVLDADLSTVISNSFGFGGSNSSLVFSK